MNEKIMLYPSINRKSLILFRVVSILFLVLGTAFFLRLVVLGLSFDAFGSRLNYVFLIVQGLVLYFLGFNITKQSRYYFAWDNNSISYLLPDSPNVERISISDIRGIEINLFDVILDVGNQKRKLRFENVGYSTLKKIKEKFESLKENLPSE